MTFTINSDLAIAAIEGNVPVGPDSFTTQKQLLALATGWPMERLVAIWNHLPAAKPVKRFTDRKTAVARIWSAIQNLAPTLDATAAQAGAVNVEVEAPLPVAGPETGAIPEMAAEALVPGAATESAAETAAPEAASVTPKKRKAKAAQPPPSEPASAPATSKKDLVLTLLRRQEGATMIELMNSTGWMAHSVRGFLSGQLGKKMGIAVNSVKREDGQRVYRVS
jgi:hypothetical protein